MEPPDPPKDGEEDQRGLYGFARFTVQGDHHVGFYQTWVKTILFLLGRQWLRWMDGKRRYTTDTDVPSWKQQPVTNVVYAVMRTLATKLTKQKPTLEVVPPSGDSNDRESAALGQSLLVHLWRHLKIPAKVRRAMSWFLATGQVWIRVHWDAEAGERVPLTQLVEVPNPDYDPEDPASEETIDVPCPCNEDGEPIMKNDSESAPGDDEGTGKATDDQLVDGADVPDAGQGTVEVDQARMATAKHGSHYDFEADAALVPEGEVAFDYEDPMSVRLNPDATDEDDANEMYVAKLWPKKKAARHFEVAETDLDAGGDGDREMYADLMSSAAAGSGWLGGQNILGSQLGASQDEALGDRVLVLEVYIDASEKYPLGRHWISIGRTKVWPKEGDKEYPTGEAPLPNGFWPPLLPVFSLPIPGQPQAMGVLAQIVPLNEALNTRDGKILEHEVTMAMGGKWFKHPADKGLSINSDPGQILTSKGMALGHPPMQAELHPLPEAIYNERQTIMDKIRLVGALSEAGFSKTGEGITAGRPMLVQQEEVDSVLTPDLEAWERVYEEAGRRMLVLCQRHYREERKIKIRGERGKWEVRSFDGTDLVDGLDVRVQVGSSFPWSKAAQYDAKVNMLTKFPGLVQQPDGTVNQERMAQILDVAGSGLESFQSDADEDLEEIEREHAMFEAYHSTRDEPPAEALERLPQLAFWQDQAKHLKGHYRFMKIDRARYDRWSPEAQQAFLNHMKLHAQAVDQIAEGIVTATGAGLPGGPPAPVQPPSAPPGGGTGRPGAPAAAAPGAPTPPPNFAPTAGASGAGGDSNPNDQPALTRADFASAQAA